MSTTRIHRRARVQAMTHVLRKIMVVATFTMGSGVFGTLYFLFILFTENGKSPYHTLQILKSIHEAIILGFFGGLILYAAPSFILGIIIATITPKRRLKTYYIIATISPALLLAYQYISYYFTNNKKNIFKEIYPEDPSQFFVMCTLYSISSLFVSWLALPRDK